MTAITIIIRGKVEICSHENKHIKSLFLTCKFVNAHYDRSFTEDQGINDIILQEMCYLSGNVHR